MRWQRLHMHGLEEASSRQVRQPAGVIAAAWSGDEALTEALEHPPLWLSEASSFDWTPAETIPIDAYNLNILGRGVGFGAAQEAALKLEETCGLHGEAFSAAEVLHGPMALVKPGFPVFLFAQGDDAGAGMSAMADQLADRGAAPIPPCSRCC
jgi:glucosamine--fructose-6-phosphate aminotransferase (isomerizing)